MKTLFRRLLLWIVGKVGVRLVDQRTGQLIARVLIFGWGGRIHIIGLPNTGEVPEVQPHFRPQQQMTFYRQELQLASHPEPDFPHERDT